jgi:hypothetical protein
MSAAKYLASIVLPLTSLWLHGCDVQGSVQNFIDTHAEAACEQIESQTVAPLYDGALSAVDTKCATDADPATCKNCGANGLNQVKIAQDSSFVEECAEAAKNILNDTGAVETWMNETGPAFIQVVNSSFQQVISNPNGYCEGAGTGVTRLFQALPRLTKGRKGRKNALILGFSTVAFVASVAFVVVRRSRRSYEPQGDMEDALNEDVDIE